MLNISGNAKMTTPALPRAYRYIFHLKNGDKIELTDLIDEKNGIFAEHMLELGGSSSINSFPTFKLSLVMDKIFYDLKKLDWVEVYTAAIDGNTPQNWVRIFNGCILKAKAKFPEGQEKGVLDCVLISQFFKLEVKRLSFDFKSKTFPLKKFLALLINYAEVKDCEVRLDPEIEQYEFSIPTFSSNMTPLTLFKHFCLVNTLFYEFLPEGAMNLISLESMIKQLEPDPNGPVLNDENVLSMEINII
ncbi:MAG: hypothetical protein AB7I41_03130 [Candidatus Sericytochromatia bacterium]